MVAEEAGEVETYICSSHFLVVIFLPSTMIILLLLTGALANGQRFDAEIFPPEMSEGLHKLLKPSELHYMFGTEDPQAVDTSQYVVVALHNTLHQERDKAKRNGEKEPDAAFKLDMFGNEYNMR